MSKKDDDDKVKVSQCEKKSMVIQGIKDRSKIRESEVIRKQGCRDEGETREAKEGKQGKARRWVSVGRRGDPGEIQGRSIDLKGFGVQGYWRKYRKRGQGGLGGGGKGDTRTMECGGVLGSLVGSDEGD